MTACPSPSYVSNSIIYHERVCNWITFWNPLTSTVGRMPFLNIPHVSLGSLKKAQKIFKLSPTMLCIYIFLRTIYFQPLTQRLGTRLIYFLKVIIETMFVGRCFRYRGLRHHRFPAYWLFGNMFHTRQMFLYNLVSKQYCKFYRHLLIYVP